MEEEVKEVREKRRKKEEKIFPPGLLGSVLPEDPQLLPSIHAASSVTHMWTTAAQKPTKASQSLENFIIFSPHASRTFC